MLFYRWFYHLCSSQLVFIFPLMKLMKPPPCTCLMTINSWEMLKVINFTTEIDFFQAELHSWPVGLCSLSEISALYRFFTLCVFASLPLPPLSQFFPTLFCVSLSSLLLSLYLPPCIVSLSINLTSMQLNGIIPILMMKQPLRCKVTCPRLHS